ncbi:hypothetical protein LCGC14_1157210 [marine sediment metagenome]|uniref:Uncharacterized protein n=1 Tax=marine sediment metagenome TaxID=412755 RepID=A0A0F9MGS9_9ZZZZ
MKEKLNLNENNRSNTSGYRSLDKLRCLVLQGEDFFKQSLEFKHKGRFLNIVVVC